MSEFKLEREPDNAAIAFGNAFFNGHGHVAMLHSAVTKAGFVVNGRAKLSPWAFSALDPDRQERQP